MDIKKEEVIEIAKANGLNEEEAEKLLEVLAKKSGGMLIDVIKLIANKLENESIKGVALMLIGAIEPVGRKMIDDIEVTL